MLTLTILGNNSAMMAHGRHPTSQVLQMGESIYLIDCGEGTQEQLSRYKIKRSKIEAIFISHLHGDHYFGLIGLLTSMGMLNRTRDLQIYAPALLWEIISLQLDAAATILPYRIHFHALEQLGSSVIVNNLRVEPFPVSHRIPCHGFLFTEIKNSRSLNMVAVTAQAVPVTFYGALQKGENFITASGAIIANEELTFAAAAPRTYAYAADTKYDESIAKKVKGAHLLYHESTYLHEDEQKAIDRFHSTSTQAAKIASLAGVEKLILGHFSSKYMDLTPFAEEAKKIFENTEIAEEGSCFTC